MKVHARAVLALIVAVALVVAGWTAAVSSTGVDDSREVADRAIFKGGPIRVGPRILALSNESHAVVGVTGVSMENCNLVLRLDHQPGQRVMAAVVEEDETISKLGIQAGLSGGASRGTISFYRDGRKVCADSPVFGKRANVWVSIVTIDAPAADPEPSEDPAAEPTLEPTHEPTGP